MSKGKKAKRVSLDFASAQRRQVAAYRSSPRGRILLKVKASSRSSIKGGRVAFFLGLSTLVSCAPSQPTSDAPNVLLITLDSVRADVVGAYGNTPRFTDRSPSPWLDRLASEGLLFENAYSTSSWTLPSHVSIFTGQPEMVHGVEQDGHQAPASLPLLSEELKSLGYRTAGFFSGPYLDPAFGFARGFDQYRASYGDELRYAKEKLRKSQERLKRVAEKSSKGKLHTALEAHAQAQRALELASHRDRSSKHIADAVIAELEAKGSEPLFLFAHFFDPHYDYAPPTELAQAFDPDYTGTIDGRDFIHDPRILERGPEGPVRRINERDLQHLWALYEAELCWSDSQVGRILDRLEELGLADDTLVIVTADHGDEFFEHGSIGHRSTLFDELVHVPLIVRYPRTITEPRQIKTPVSLIEIAPTILKVASGNPATSGGQRPGNGLLAIAAGKEPGPVLARIVESYERTIERDGVRYQALQTRGLETYRQGPIKILRKLQRTQIPNSPPSSNEALFVTNIEQDPAEAKQRRRFRDADERQALATFRKVYVRLAELRQPANKSTVTEDLLSALAGLGYVDQEGRIGALDANELSFDPPGNPPEAQDDE